MGKSTEDKNWDDAWEELEEQLKAEGLLDD